MCRRTPPDREVEPGLGDREVEPGLGDREVEPGLGEVFGEISSPTNLSPLAWLSLATIQASELRPGLIYSGGSSCVSRHGCTCVIT